jgi:hypothetical protein
MRIVCYFPLMAIGLEVLWVIVLVMGLLFMVGDEPYTNTPAKEHVFDCIAVIPVAVGLLSGLVALACRWPARKWEWIGLILGSLGCGFIVYGFVSGSLR